MKNEKNAYTTIVVHSLPKGLRSAVIAFQVNFIYFVKCR